MFMWPVGFAAAAIPHRDLAALPCRFRDQWPTSLLPLWEKRNSEISNRGLRHVSLFRSLKKAGDRSTRTTSICARVLFSTS